MSRLLFWGCFFLFNQYVIASTFSCQSQHCLAVIDAGSTGSRLHLYAYDLDARQTPIHINEVWTKKIKPGLATIESRQDVINAYLDRLFEEVPQQNMPLYLYATGGMRLIPSEKQRIYYEGIREWFSSQSQWDLIEARTITGKEEGIWGWLAVNEQLGRFDTKAMPLVSVMDMGGASVQITFAVERKENADAHDLTEVEVAGRRLVLFVRSFLGLGQTIASQAFYENESCFPKGYPLPSGLKAEGHALACQKSVSKLINNVFKVNRIVQPALSHPNAHEWVAIGGLASLAQEPPFSFENNQLTSDHLLLKAHSSICQAQWDSLIIQYPNNDYLFSDCLAPAYFYALMVKGYGLSPQQPIHFLPAGKGSDWTLGVVLIKQPL